MFWAYLVSIFALVIASTKPSGLPRKCQMKRISGVVYSPRASNHHGKIIRSTNSSDESECRTSCCETQSCAMYMFSTVHILHKRGVNCLLIFCGNTSLCVTKALPENETGLSVVGIRQDNINNTSVVNSSVKNSTEKQVVVTNSISETASKKTSTVIGGSLSNTTVPRIPGDSSSMLQDSQSSHPSSHTSHTPTNSTKRKNPSKKFLESRSHTTPISLVLSLIIGILFFGIVVFLIGRRWGEMCFRRGYSRVDYLLNDHD